jgi:hypothetical protein
LSEVWLLNFLRSTYSCHSTPVNTFHNPQRTGLSQWRRSLLSARFPDVGEYKAFWVLERNIYTVYTNQCFFQCQSMQLDVQTSHPAEQLAISSSRCLRRCAIWLLRW